MESGGCTNHNNHTVNMKTTNNTQWERLSSSTPHNWGHEHLVMNGESIKILHYNTDEHTKVCEQSELDEHTKVCEQSII